MNSQEERQEAVKLLEANKLDYLITVDIFNEGVDIPSVNQVVMLRQTESSIIFVQQLGRGLRKHEDKEFLTVIDFIGNYKNNYLIPVALTGDKSFNKDRLRKDVVDRSLITGESTINFERIAQDRIFKSISKNIRFTSEFKTNVSLYKEQTRSYPNFSGSSNRSRFDESNVSFK
ncbi:helicase-related protein [Jeotgalicoccus sp. WY2]|uniref:helicase-related protein n=1 Tax=Jeotgalicoccus sp. WY2 TaxID=2708346 RepID=UPI002021C8F1|nr:helicase-related protein [Jeotgalicoccus sp. WY2]